MLNKSDKAPAFTLPDLNGEPQALSAILDKGPALLALYKVSCPTCQLTLPFLERISKGSLQVVTVSQDDEADTRKFRQTYGLSLPALIDPKAAGYTVSNAFGVTHVPSLFLVEPDGTISYAGSGFRKAELEQIGARSGVAVFTQKDHVPEWKAG
jgi:peroxiredoxin